MASRFTNAYDDEEPEDEVEDTEQPVETTTSFSRFTNAYDDDTPKVLETEADVFSTQSGTSRFTNAYDDDDTEEVAEDAVAPEPIIEETPEQIYMRTGEAPTGYKTVPTVPTADTGFESLGVKLELIDAPKPTVSEQTDSAFGYEGTKEMAELFSEPIDIIGAEEFVEKNIPESIQPIANWVGSAVNKDLANLVIAMEAAAETTANIGVGLTKGLKAIGVDIPFEDRDAGEKFAGDIGMALEMIEAVIPGGSAAMRPVRRLYRDSARKAKDKVKAEKAREKLLNRKMNINKAKTATAEEVAAKTTKAEQVAAENVDLKNELILGFEDATGKTISREVDGVRVVDDDLARQAGRETAEEIDFKDTRSQTAKALGISDVEADDAAKLAGVGDTITAPILKPEKLDGLVAAAADLKGKYPTAFDNDKTVIDNLLDLTINKELIAGDELIDTLNKYNVSFEDYILTVVGSGSDAGKVLNKLSQIKRARPLNEMQELSRAATQARQGQIRNNIMRIEGIRRGGLVSQLATAARNVTSAGIRAPLDTLGNLMDTALYNAGEAQGLGRKTKVLAESVSPTTALGRENWADSFRHMKYMFGPESRLDSKEYVEFILNRPELAKQYDLMFNQLNELQQATGRGQATTKLGKGVDTVLSELEDGVSVLNSANRWQEYLVRRGAFLGELERLVKREYKIDLIDTLNDGKIKDLLNDSTTVRPKGARSFNELVADATNNALDVTYAKQPDIGVFREATSFITRNGLTVVMPFPRFMFNSMELMGNYAGGASIPLTKKLMGQLPKGTKLSTKDRQRISRNLVGIATVGAAYMARSGEDAPADYKEINVGDGTVMDTTPQFPLRQMLYLGEATKRLQDGTFDDWYNTKEFAETFLGTNLRTGVGNSIVDEVVALAGGSDLTKDEKIGRATGRALGNYLSTWMVPFAQIIDSQRAIGQRGEVYKDVAEDPTLELGSTFRKELSRPFKARGFTTSAEEEAALPNREFLFQEEGSRVGSGLKVGLGLTMRTKDSPEGEYIKGLGFTEFELASKSKVPSIRRFENQQLRGIIPGIVSLAQSFEEDSRNTYRSSDALQEEMTEEEFVNSRIRPYIKSQIASAKQLLTDGNTVNSEAPEYVAAMSAYRKLPPEIRKAAASEFLLQEERVPDGASMEDLFRLAEYGKAYQQAYK
tara:strand:- start:166 stop:3684 length:3519 start_codon:yes stop_codon:yes gene_type:complete